MQEPNVFGRLQLIKSIVPLLLFAATSVHTVSTSERLLFVGLTNSTNDQAFVRFNRSIAAYGLDLVVLESKPLKKALATYKTDADLVLFVVDAQSTIVNADREQILAKFNNFKPQARVLISADSICWPDKSLESRYGQLSGDGQRFLNSNAFIGSATTIWSLLEDFEGDKRDLQSYLTGVYLDSGKRLKLALEIDHRAEVIQNLQAQDEVELDFSSGEGVRLKNVASSNEPAVIHSSTNKLALNSLGNYLGKAWTERDGCRHCNESVVSLSGVQDDEMPTVLLGLFIEEPTPFLADFFDDVQRLSYPKRRMHLYIHNLVQYHDKHVDEFVRSFGLQYASQEVIRSSTGHWAREWEGRQLGLEKCGQLECDYYFVLDSVARLELPETLLRLIETNKTVVGPMLSRPGKLWSNFWGALTSDGYYARSFDYVHLVRQDRVGLWNVPLIMNAYLLDGRLLRANLSNGKLSYRNEALGGMKASLVFAHQLRLSGIDQFVLNTLEFGHLVDPSSYNTSLTHPDLYQLADNMADWERHYLHENYSQLLDEDTRLEQPCQDVFWFPLVNDRFCGQLIELMEAYGQWSGGTNEDPRIEGGYESVPTRDIHMKQVGLHEMWLTFLREYVMPVQLKEYVGYEHDPPRAELAFVVRYHPAEQPSLRPHHDASTYTLNIALNSPQLDYEGGGCRFARYNCSVTDSRKGWALIHPGRLTHYHEGLPVTNGTRYIMVTFVDP